MSSWEVVVQVVVDFRYKQDNYTMLPPRRLGGFENESPNEKKYILFCVMKKTNVIKNDTKNIFSSFGLSFSNHPSLPTLCDYPRLVQWILTTTSSRFSSIFQCPYWDSLTPIQWADLYHTVFNITVFFGPALVIVVSYSRSWICLVTFETSTLFTGFTTCWKSATHHLFLE